MFVRFVSVRTRVLPWVEIYVLRFERLFSHTTFAVATDTKRFSEATCTYDYMTCTLQICRAVQKSVLGAAHASTRVTKRVKARKRRCTIIMAAIRSAHFTTYRTLRSTASLLQGVQGSERNDMTLCSADLAEVLSRDDEGETVFSERRSVIFKTLKVKRIFDEENNTLVYISHARDVQNGSAKMSMSTVPLYVPTK